MKELEHTRFHAILENIKTILKNPVVEQNDSLILMPGSQRKGIKEQLFPWEQPWHCRKPQD